MAQQHVPTAAELADTAAAARESAPLPWSAEAYYNVAVDPAPQHGLHAEARVGVARHAGDLYHSDYGPVVTTLDSWWGSKGRVRGG